MSNELEITTRTYTPQPVEAQIKPHQIGKKLTKDCVTVKLNSEEYAFCEESAGGIWANGKTGAYGGGILNSEKDSTKTERTGILGEMAFAKLAALTVDTTYSEGGAPHDFEGLYGTIDVKTAAKLHGYKSMLVYAKSGSGKEIPLTSKFYVAAYLTNDNREEQKATVIIVGWCTKETLAAKPLVPGKAGHWFNREMPYNELRNIKELLEIINGDSNKAQETIPGKKSRPAQANK